MNERRREADNAIFRDLLGGTIPASFLPPLDPLVDWDISMRQLAGVPVLAAR
jgi:hypothetical protein